MSSHFSLAVVDGMDGSQVWVTNRRVLSETRVVMTTIASVLCLGVEDRMHRSETGYGCDRELKARTTKRPTLKSTHPHCRAPQVAPTTPHPLTYSASFKNFQFWRGHSSLRDTASEHVDDDQQGSNSNSHHLKTVTGHSTASSLLAQAADLAT